MEEVCPNTLRKPFFKKPFPVVIEKLRPPHAPCTYPNNTYIRVPVLIEVTNFKLKNCVFGIKGVPRPETKFPISFVKVNYKSASKGVN